MTRTSSTQQSEPGPKSLTQRQTTLVILRVAERAVLAGGTGCGCRRAHPRARTGRAAPSRTALRSVGAHEGNLDQVARQVLQLADLDRHGLAAVVDGELRSGDPVSLSLCELRERVPQGVSRDGGGRG